MLLGNKSLSKIVLDAVLKNGAKGVLGGSAGKRSSGGAGDILGQLGGLPGILEQLKKAGLGKQVESWVGKGNNLAVTGDQLQSALGPERIEELANQLGMPSATLKNQLAEVLPEVVNQVTPNGHVPDDAELEQEVNRVRRMLG